MILGNCHRLAMFLGALHISVTSQHLIVRLNIFEELPLATSSNYDELLPPGPFTVRTFAGNGGTLRIQNHLDRSSNQLPVFVGETFSALVGCRCSAGYWSNGAI